MATEHLQVIADTLMQTWTSCRGLPFPLSPTVPCPRSAQLTQDWILLHAMCARAGLRPPAVVVVGEVVTISEQISELCGGLAGIAAVGNVRAPRWSAEHGAGDPRCAGQWTGRHGGSAGSPRTREPAA